MVLSMQERDQDVVKCVPLFRVWSCVVSVSGDVVLVGCWYCGVVVVSKVQGDVGEPLDRTTVHGGVVTC
jgi:hypothetical protein